MPKSNVTHYLEFDSTYRNREDWPLPSNFRIDISQSGVKDRLFALDPISDAASKLSFISSFSSTGGSNIIASAAYLARSGERLEFIISFSASTNQKIDEFYTGASINFDNSSVDRTITSYRVLDGVNLVGGLTYALITIDDPVPDLNEIGTLNIRNPENPGFSVNPTLFLPTGKGIDNYYKGCTIYNESLGETRTIIGYSSVKRLATLSSPAPTWGANQEYFIRSSPPCNTGIVGVSTSTTVTLDPLTASDIDNFYKNGFLRIGLIPGAIVPPYTIIPAPWNESRRIINYDGFTKIATVSPPFSVAPSAPNNTYAVECYSRDNVVPFNYIGSLVSHQQSVCYEIELVNITLPNEVLCSGFGGRAAFYPYIYVGLVGISSSTTSGNMIYSNNPNSSRKMFRAAVDNTPTPLISPFVKIDGDGMVQTVKFKPNDSFQFTVCLNNGDLFETTVEENFGPLPPNPLAQISALFSIRII